MATKKSATPTTALTKPRFALPANLDAQLAEDALAIVKNVGSGGGSRIRPQKDRTFLMPDGTTAPSPMPVVIVNFAHGNFYYDRPYNPESPMAPACYALAANPVELAPSDSVPVKQHDSCAGCDMNAFGSDPNGSRGKACSNTILLALLPTDVEDQEEPMSVLRVSSTALKYFNSYVQTLARMGKPPYAVSTDISIELLTGTGAQSLRFSNPKPLSREVLTIAYARRDEALSLLLTGPDTSGYQPPAPIAARRAAAQPAARRPATR